MMKIVIRWVIVVLVFGAATGYFVWSRFLLLHHGGVLGVALAWLFATSIGCGLLLTCIELVRALQRKRAVKTQLKIIFFTPTHSTESEHAKEVIRHIFRKSGKTPPESIRKIIDSAI